MKTLLRILCLAAVFGISHSALAQGETRGSFKVVAVNDCYLDGKLIQTGDTFPIGRHGECIFCDQGDNDNETYLVLRHTLSNRNYRIGSTKDLGLFASSFASSSNHLNFGEAAGRWVDDGSRTRIDRSTINSVNSGNLNVPVPNTIPVVPGVSVTP